MHSSGTHWQCVGISQLQFCSPSPSFLPLNMAGLPDDHPLSWALLEQSPEVPLQPGPPVLSFSARAHCRLTDHSSVGTHVPVHSHGTQHFVQLNLHFECPQV